jgi:hypothetical protein
MRIKRFVIAGMVILNSCLLLALMTRHGWLPSALAQPAPGRSGHYACVTAKGAGQSFDVLYILDASEHKLHGFFPGNVQTRELAYASFRDLKQDFGRP